MNASKRNQYAWKMRANGKSLDDVVHGMTGEASYISKLVRCGHPPPPAVLPLHPTHPGFAPFSGVGQDVLQLYQDLGDGRAPPSIQSRAALDEAPPGVRAVGGAPQILVDTARLQHAANGLFCRR